MFVYSRLVFAAVCVVVCAHVASASITTYSDWSSFHAAAGPVQTITFDGIAPTGGLVTEASHSALGVTFVGFTLAGDGVYIIDPGYYPLYNRNGHSSIDSFHRTSPSSFTITLPANTYAAGFDLFSVVEGHDAGAEAQTISVAGQNFVVSTLPYNAHHDGSDLAFFGFVSTVPVSTIQITTATTIGPTGVDIVRFDFGGAPPSTIPEPGTISLVAGTLGLLGVVEHRRRRGVDDSAPKSTCLASGRLKG